MNHLGERRSEGVRGKSRRVAMEQNTHVLGRRAILEAIVKEGERRRGFVGVSTLGGARGLWRETCKVLKWKTF